MLPRVITILPRVMAMLPRVIATLPRVVTMLPRVVTILPRVITMLPRVMVLRGDFRYAETSPEGAPASQGPPTAYCFSVWVVLAGLARKTKRYCLPEDNTTSLSPFFNILISTLSSPKPGWSIKSLKSATSFAWANSRFSHLSFCSIAHLLS